MKILKYAIPLIVFSFSAYAEVKFENCIICGNDIVIDTEKDSNRHYQVDIYSPDDATTGYFCKKETCRTKIKAWINAGLKNVKNHARETYTKIQKSKNQKATINKMGVKLGNYFKLAKKNNIPVQNQVAVFNKMISMCNAEIFWSAMVENASMDVIKYYWPSPKDDKVLIKSNEVIEKRMKQESAEDAANNPLNILVQSAVSSGGNSKKVHQAAAGQLEKMLMPKGVTMASKKTISAFALGVSKKDETIRHVDSKSFNIAMIKAAAKAGRSDVLDYFIEQCNGYFYDYAMFGSYFKQLALKEKKQFLIKEKIKVAEKDLKLADDKVIQKKVQKKLDLLKKSLANESYKIDADFLAYLVNKTGRDFYQIREVIFAEVDEAAGDFMVDAIRDGSYMEAATAMASGARGLDALADIAKDVLSDEERKVFLPIASSNLYSAAAKALANKNMKLSEAAKWLVEFENNWKEGVEDKYIPGYISSAEKGIWIWKQGKATNDGYFTGEKPGSKQWIAYKTVNNKPGYITGEKEMSFVWISGLPDPENVGLISGEKEGTWDTDAGFVKKGNKAVWKPGLKHPDNETVVSGQKIFTWEPVAGCIWTKPADALSLGTMNDLPKIALILLDDTLYQNAKCKTTTNVGKLDKSRKVINNARREEKGKMKGNEK